MPYAELVGDRIEVSTTWNEKDLIKSIPGSSWKSKEKIWTVRKTWTACVQLRGIFGEDLRIGPDLRAWAAGKRDLRVNPALALRDRTDVDAWAGNEKLYDFQKAGVTFLNRAGSALLGDEMGTGKTIQALETLRSLPKSLPAVVVCPKSVTGSWAREARKWFPSATPYVIIGSAVKRRKLLADASKDASALVIINFEGVRGHSKMAGFGSTALKCCTACGGDEEKESLCQVHPRELNQIPFRSVIVDEAHRIKDPNSQQTRAVWALGQGKHVTFRLPMTGTPIASHPGDLWSLLHFVDSEGFPTKSKFVERYCVTSFNGWGGLQISGLNPETADEFHKITGPIFRRMPKALVLPQLPKKISIKHYVQMGAKQEKAYKDISTSLVTRLADGSVLVPKADIAAQARLLQFSSSYMCAGKPKTVKHVDPWGVESETLEDTWIMCEPSPKLDAMEEILEDMAGNPLVICAESRQLIELAEKRLVKQGVSYGMITGKVPQWDREAQLKNFQDGKLQVMMFTIKAGGVGLTMTAADTILFLQRSWSMIENKQAEDRVHRIGSEIHDSIKVIDLITEGTVEEDQIDRLWVKSERLEEITRDREKLKAAGLSTEMLDKEEDAILAANLGEIK